MRSSLLILSLLTVTTACQKANDSSLNSLYEGLDLRLMSLGERDQDPLAAAMGAMVYGSPDTIAFLENGSDCTGIAISPTFILTAGHCQQAEPFAYVFNRDKIALDPKAESLQVAPGRMVRLQFQGDLIPAAQAAIEKPQWLTRVYRDEKRDFSIYRRPTASSDPYIDLFGTGSAKGNLALYAYPNGVPLTIAGPCRGEIGSSGLDVWHDCDSLGGSSGALLVNLDEQKPLGLHHIGGGDNWGSTYLEKGQFESAEEFESRKREFWHTQAQEADWKRASDFWNCPPQGETGAETCALAKGLNRALLFTEVLERLKTNAPAIYAALEPEPLACD